MAHVLRADKERTSSLTIYFWLIILVLFIKNVFEKIKNSIFPPKYARYHIFRININHFFIGVIFFCLLMKNVIKNRNCWFPKEPYEIRKKYTGQNCSPQEDVQVYTRLFFDWICSLRFNSKKRYKKLKILICIKSVWDKKNMLEKKIIRFKKFYKLTPAYFFMRIIFFSFILKKRLYVKIANSNFLPKYTR